MRSVLFFLILSPLASASAAPEATALPEVITTPAEYKETSDELLYPARVTSSRTVSVPAEIEGAVQELPVRMGQHVKAGQILMTLRNPDPAYEFKNFVVRAPFSGVVTRLDVVAGDRVPKGKAILDLTDNSNLKVLVKLVGKDVHFIQRGLPATLILGKQEFSLRVKDLSPVLDSISGTAACELEFSSPSRNLHAPLSGSIAQARFSINKRKALLLPERAIVYRGLDPFVIRVHENAKAQYIAVKILKQSSGLVEVESQIRPGEQIVINSPGFIVDGSSVEIKSRKI